MLTSQQKRLYDYFEKAAKNDSLRHSYIIKGEQGSGKKHVVKHVLKAIMCDTNCACGNCNSCRTVDSGAHPDVAWVSNGDDKTIKIQKIREQIINTAYVKPAFGKRKIYVIENAHLMDPAPQNSLLKLIEEPPSYAVFIFLCDNLNVILPTILSRVMVLELSPVSPDELRQLCPVEADDGFMYNYCQGNLGRLKLLCNDNGFKTLRENFVSALVKYVKSDAYGAYEMIDFWNANKDGKDTLFDVFVLFMRDVIYFKNNMKQNIANTDKIKEIEAVSAVLTLKKSYEMFEAACNLPSQLGKYGNLNMLVNTVFIRLKEEIND